LARAQPSARALSRADATRSRIESATAPARNGCAIAERMVRSELDVADAIHIHGAIPNPM
jgi:hypothetical protein